MSIEQAFEFSRKSVIPISLGMMLLIVGGVWKTALGFSALNNRLGNMELRLSNIEHDLSERTRRRWDWRMEAYAWREFERTGKAPNVDDIRRIFEPD